MELYPVKRPRFRFANFAWLCLAIFLTFVAYYVLEAGLIFGGELLMGSVALFKTGIPDYRILLLPLGGLIILSAFWSRIKPHP
jgi:hypothetical protein